MAKVGHVTHYFDRIRVAVLELEDELYLGDWVLFVRHGDSLFEQEVTSMQINHQSIEAAGPGDEVALRVDHEVKAGTEVFVAEE